MTEAVKYASVSITIPSSDAPVPPVVPSPSPSLSPSPSSSRCQCRPLGLLSCLAFWILLTAASVATFGGMAWNQQKMNKDIRSHILTYPLYPAPGANLSCRLQAAPKEQYECHVKEATAKYEQWKQDMMATTRENSTFESLIQPHLSAFAYHVHYSAFADPPLMDDRNYHLPLNISVWEARLRIERYPQPRQRHIWMDLVTIRSPPPFLARNAARSESANNFNKGSPPRQNAAEDFEALYTRKVVEFGISHFMNQAAGLCEPDKVGQSTSRRSDAEVDYFISNRKGSVGQFIPWSRIPNHADSIIIRGALGLWLRSELLRLGVPMKSVTPLTWNQYVVKTAVISGASLQEQAQRYNYSFPSCLFRPATADQLVDVASDSASSSDWYFGPQLTISTKANHTGKAVTELDKHQQWVLTHLDSGEEGSKLLRADNFTDDDELGSLGFVRPAGVGLTSQPGQAEDLEISGEHNQTVEWSRPSAPIWHGVEADLRLHSGSFRIDLAIESLLSHSILIGFLLASDPWPDWDFFGILGSSTSSWAYDLGVGSLTFNKKKIATQLPKLFKANPGAITLQLDLPQDSFGRAQFRVNGALAVSFLLPRSSVVVPAVSLMRFGERVRLSSLGKRAVSQGTIAEIEAEAARLLKL